MSAEIVAQVAGIAGAIVFVLLAFRFFGKEKYPTSVMFGLVAAVCLLCSFPWFQGLAKTLIMSKVNSQLVSLGQQVNAIQGTTATMQTELGEHQKAIDSHQKELEDQQRKLRNTHTNLINQAHTISDAVHQVSELQSDLAVAETNLIAQQQALTNVESLVNLLYSNTEDETFSTSDTNKVAILHLASVQMACFRLQSAPIPYSVQAMVSARHSQIPLLPKMVQLGNILTTYFFNEVDLNGAEFHFRYIKDARNHLLAKTIAKVDTNAVSIDGYIQVFK